MNRISAGICSLAGNGIKNSDTSMELESMDTTMRASIAFKYLSIYTTGYYVSGTSGSSK